MAILLFSAKFLIRSDCWSTKEKLFASGLSVHSQNAKMFYNFANTKRDRRDFREAILLYKEAIRLHPKYAKAFDNLGAIYDDGTSDGMEQAEEMYQKAINANPHHPSAYCNLANLMASQERLGEAVQILLQVNIILYHSSINY